MKPLDDFDQLCCLPGAQLPAGAATKKAVITGLLGMYGKHIIAWLLDWHRVVDNNVAYCDLGGCCWCCYLQTSIAAVSYQRRQDL
jgi:hypothetical protein